MFFKNIFYSSFFIFLLAFFMSNTAFARVKSNYSAQGISSGTCENTKLKLTIPRRGNKASATVTVKGKSKTFAVNVNYNGRHMNSTLFSEEGTNITSYSNVKAVVPSDDGKWRTYETNKKKKNVTTHKHLEIRFSADRRTVSQIVISKYSGLVSSNTTCSMIPVSSKSL